MLSPRVLSDITQRERRKTKKIHMKDYFHMKRIILSTTKIFCCKKGAQKKSMFRGFRNLFPAKKVTEKQLHEFVRSELEQFLKHPELCTKIREIVVKELEKRKPKTGAGVATNTTQVAGNATQQSTTAATSSAPSPVQKESNPHKNDKSLSHTSDGWTQRTNGTQRASTTSGTQRTSATRTSATRQRAQAPQPTPQTQASAQPYVQPQPAQHQRPQQRTYNTYQPAQTSTTTNSMAASPEPELNLLEYFGTCVFDKFFITEGRARRKEIWGFMLFATLIYIVLLFLVAVGIIPEKVTYFYALIVFLPNLAVTIRRLHDLGFSGWWLLAGLIPFVGLLGAIPLLFEEGEKRRNKYGHNPKRWPLKLMKQQSVTLTKGWRMLHIIQTIPLARSITQVLRAFLYPEGYWIRKDIDISTLRYCPKTGTLELTYICRQNQNQYLLTFEGLNTMAREKKI